MRDIDLYNATDPAYARQPPGSVSSGTTAVDPAFNDSKAYLYPSLGGDYGPARSPILGAQADGGAALLAADPVLTVTPPVVPTPPNPMALGRAANNSSFLNLYPWFKTPKEGLDMNNPNPPPAPPPGPPPAPPAHGISMPVMQLVGNDGTVQFSGPAATSAVVTLNYAIDGTPQPAIVVNIIAGDTASQIAAKVRNAVDATFGVDADGTGGTAHVVGIGGNLTSFNVTIA